MRLGRRALLSAPVLLPLAGLPVGGWAAVGGDALWVWRTPASDWAAVATVMAGQGLTTAFLSIPPGDRAAMTAADLDRALAPFAARRLTVLLAGGAPGWGEGRAEMPPALIDLLDLAAAAGGVAGVQLDIEPYTLPSWKAGEAGRASIAATLLGRLEAARDRLARHGKRLGMVLHPAFANAPAPAGGSLAEAVPARVDELVVMAYRNSPEATERFARRLLTAIDATPRPWRFGITVQGGPDQATISYADAPYPRIRADIAELDRIGSGRPSSGSGYRGVAVHAYASLLPKLAG